MMVRRASLVLCLAAGLLAGAAARAGDDRACGDADAAGYAACALQRAGAPTGAQVAARGDEMIRVLVTKPNYIVPEIVIVEIVLPRSGDGRVVLRDPEARGVRRTYRFARAAFETLRGKLLALRDAGAVLHGARAGGGHPCQIETVCLHGAVALVDVVLGGRTADAVLGFCETPDYAFVNAVLAFAAARDPACAPLSDYEGWDAGGLRDCMRVQGDRATAAKAFVASQMLGEWQARWDLKAKDLALIAPDAHLRIAGQPALSGGDAVARRWHAMAGDDGEHYDYSTDTAVAAAGRIVVRGTMRQDIRQSDEATASFRAPFVQVWRSGADGKPRLVEWQVAGFVPVP
ncbi:MAG TPA: hypothetical protein VHZ78_08960 [Rhizomicrobium sp.]|jgi:hypothetical protein|nr:hypothetical protein [Rhizomicrobium sp.]